MFFISLVFLFIYFKNIINLFLIMKNEKLGCQKRKNKYTNLSFFFFLISKYTNLSFNTCYQNMGVSML